MKSSETLNLERLNTAKFLKTGDRGAFQWLYTRHEESFRTYAFKLTAPWDVKDLIQLTSLQLLQYDGVKKDPEKFNFKTFFLASIHNTMINLRRKRQIKVSELPAEFLVLDNGPYFEHDYSALIHFIELLLNHRQKQVMYMRIKGIKFKEIARKMDTSHSTVAGLFRTGRLRLKPYRNYILNL